MRILLLSVLLVFSQFGSADGMPEDFKSKEPLITPAKAAAPAPVSVTLPEAPSQPTAQSCDKYGVELFNSCKHELDAVIVSNTQILGNASLANESDVAKTESGAATAANASALKGVQANYCKAAAEQCASVCEQARDFHVAKEQMDEANKAIESGKKNCGAIMAVVNDSNLNAASLANHSGEMADTAEKMKGAESSSGGMGGMMAPLLGAGAALGAMCLMGRGICQDDEDDDDDDSGSNKPGSEDDIDCNKSENHMYAKCEDHYINLCQANSDGTGCNDFNNLYCGMSLSVAGSGDGVKVNNKLPMVSENAGVGSTYCQYQVSVDYCKDDGTASCPSCRQLEQSKSPVCQDNPSTCLPGWTQVQMEEAKSYCPTDPMFMTAGGSGGSSTSSGETTAETNDDGSSTSGDGSSGVPSGSGTSVADGTGDGQATSDTTSLDKIVNTGNTTAGSYGSSGTFNPYGDLTTSSVGSAFGPSLFANSSEVYNEKCALGLIDNCGPREGLGAESSQGAQGTN